MNESSLLDACRTLFGQDITLSREFLYYLQPSGAKLAYRNQVKINHPDRFNDSSLHVRQQQAERFREIHDAYHLIKGFLDQEHRRAFDPHHPSPRTRQTGTYNRPAARSAYNPSGMKWSQRTMIPTIQLEFGMYAYYMGKISYNDLIEALIWQRRQRPMLGALATRWGWLNDHQIGRILSYRGQSTRFGKKAIELGLLSPLQVDSLVRHQRTLQQRIGQYFVSKGLINAAEADRLAHSLELHNKQVSAHARRRQAKRR